MQTFNNLKLTETQRYYFTALHLNFFSKGKKITVTLTSQLIFLNAHGDFAHQVSALVDIIRRG